MTRDDIIRLAREAGFLVEDSAFGADVYEKSGNVSISTELERFAALVAAAEREQCALIAESYEPRCDTCPSGVTNAIRARGKK